MDTPTRYLTIEESEIYEKIAKKYNIKGYSTSTYLVCTPPCTEFDTARRGRKTMRKAQKRKVKNK